MGYLHIGVDREQHSVLLLLQLFHLVLQRPGDKLLLLRACRLQVWVDLLDELVQEVVGIADGLFLPVLLAAQKEPSVLLSLLYLHQELNNNIDQGE